MSLIAEILISALLLIGGIFGIVGSYGLIKLRDSMARLHAPTKATTLGVGGVLLASLANAWLIRADISVHELLITLFLFLTAPITAHFIAKAYLHRRIKPTDLPSAGTDKTWAYVNTENTDLDSGRKTTELSKEA